TQEPSPVPACGERACPRLDRGSALSSAPGEGASPRGLSLWKARLSRPSPCKRGEGEEVPATCDYDGLQGGEGENAKRQVSVCCLRPSLQLIGIDPVLILRIDLHLRHRLVLALIERRHGGLGRPEGGEMRLRLDETPVIRIGRPVAPRGPVGL